MLAISRLFLFQEIKIAIVEVEMWWMNNWILSRIIKPSHLCYKTRGWYSAVIQRVVVLFPNWMKKCRKPMRYLPSFWSTFLAVRQLSITADQVWANRVYKFLIALFIKRRIGWENHKNNCCSEENILNLRLLDDPPMKSLSHTLDFDRQPGVNR